MNAAPAHLVPAIDHDQSEAVLPRACGPLSHAVIEALSTGCTAALPAVPADVEPLGRDLQLSLYTLYELH